MGFVVRHLDHNFAGLGEAIPEQLQYTYTLAEPSTVQYELDINHNLATRASVQPYVTDFLLLRNGTEFLGGLHTGVSLDEVLIRLQISGKDYKHYLEKRQFPFDPTDLTAYTFEKPATDVFVIAEAILAVVLAETNSLQMFYANGLLGQTIDYRIDPGDSETIYEKISQFAEADTNGFDWLVTHDRWVRFYAPQKGAANSYIFERGKNLEALSFEDNGPVGNHCLGLGAGTASRLGSVVDNAASQATYRRLDKVMDFGAAVIDQAALDDLATGMAAGHGMPRLKIQAEVVFDYIDEVFDEVALGDTCRFIGDTHYLSIDANYRIIGFQGGQRDSESTEQLTLLLQEEIT